MQFRVGIVGSGNIGTDLLYKLRRNPSLELAGVAGVDPDSDGLARARALGVTATHDGLERLLELEPGIELVFDATSARAHLTHSSLLAEHGIRCVDLTPAALGPPVVPTVNLAEHLDAPEVSLVTCGAQATVPIVAALAERFPIPYAEMVSTVASRSAGPGTRQNIDEFTIATARSLESLGRAGRGKAIIILNPADPPILMRNTVYARSPELEREAALEAVDRTVEEVSRYVPGYRLAAEPAIDGDRIAVVLVVEGAADYLPSYAGNLDIMTSAAVRVAEMQAGEADAGMTANGRRIRLLDATLRDGSHAIGHRFTPDQVRTIAGRLDEAGVYAIGVGHGDGIGGSSSSTASAPIPTRSSTRLRSGRSRRRSSPRR